MSLTTQANNFLKRILSGERKAKPRLIKISDKRVLKAMYFLSYHEQRKVENLINEVLELGLKSYGNTMVKKFINNPEYEIGVVESTILVNSTSRKAVAKQHSEAGSNGASKLRASPAGDGFFFTRPEQENK